MYKFEVMFLHVLCMYTTYIERKLKLSNICTESDLILYWITSLATISINLTKSPKEIL